MSLKDFARKHVSTARTRGLRPAIAEAGQEFAFKAMGVADGPLRTPIWADEWDVCLILDACRIDLMQEVADEYEFLPESIDKKWSVGSASPEWISNTFALEYGDELERTAYVTGNAFAERDPDTIRFLDPDVVPMSEQSNLAYLDEPFVDQWDHDLNGMETIDPEVITGRGLHAYDTVDADRLVVHYMQPHMPFRMFPEWFDGWGGASNFGSVSEQLDTDIWHKLRDGQLGEREFWQAYRDNLRWVLDEVRRWVEHVDGRILITSDHGNAKGEWGLWSHPPGMASPQLRWVPWILVNGKGWGVEYDVVGEPPVVGAGETDTEEQLRALGYV